MNSQFIQRLNSISLERKSKIILALDYCEVNSSKLEKKCLEIISKLKNKIIAIKINYHVLLPLDLKSLEKIVEIAHEYNIQVIADIKLNDISSTNLCVGKYFWKIGFDSLIANPIVGFKEGLTPLIHQAHSLGKGIILIVFMSHKGSNEGYGLKVIKNDGSISSIYELFLEKAMKFNVDGVIVGATNTLIMQKVSERLKGKIPIFSPGLGFQGGSHVEAIKAGADFLIIGRTIFNSNNPETVTEKIRLDSWNI